METKPIITDSSSFEQYRERDAIYVDKTVQLHRLITNVSCRTYSISRPPRFGVSLLFSTLEAIFRGRRDLFRGQAIDSLEYDWKEYPVLWFDFWGTQAQTYEDFKTQFVGMVRLTIRSAGASWYPEDLPPTNFSRVIHELSSKTQKPVVVLIDEYDAPVMYCLNDCETAERIRDELSCFWGRIKADGDRMCFALMAGKSNYSPHSVFSSFNNVTDLTLDEETVDLVGYSEDDLETYFGEPMHEHASKMGLSYEEYRTQLRIWSDGYRFSPESEVRMYNPSSIANTLANMEPYWGPSWTTTAHPSFLTKFADRKAFYAALSYGSYEKEIRQSEYAYARIFKTLLESTGLELRAEDRQSTGRSDLVAKGPQGTYVFEFKVDRSAAEAMVQIKEKDDAAPYRARGVPIYAFGLNFSSETPRLTDFAVVELGFETTRRTDSSLTSPIPIHRQRYENKRHCRTHGGAA